MTMAHDWREIRADGVAWTLRGPTRRASRCMTAVQAHRLSEIRKAQGHARQADVAAVMGVWHARVSELEGGDLLHTELGTLRSYVAALGREPWVVADFGDITVELTA
jgi:hypothetical protein